MVNKFVILVKTGNQVKAGTSTNVWVELEDEKGLRIYSIKLSTAFYRDRERGRLDSYKENIPKTFNKLHTLYLCKDSKSNDDKWFCDYVIVQDLRVDGGGRKICNIDAPGTTTIKCNMRRFHAEYYFPIHRWIRPNYLYKFYNYATYLPQDDPVSRVREEDLQEKREVYCFKKNDGCIPARIIELPGDEKFSKEYVWNIVSEKMKLLAKTRFIEWTTRKWKSFEELKSIHNKGINKPECLDVWHEDWWFGLQRLQGVNPVIIRLCKSIPQKFAVYENTVLSLLDDLTLDEALNQNRIYICDLKIVEDLRCKDDRQIACPVALFYLNKEQNLLPIAIQLMQHKGPLNPVYTPNDAKECWLVAKLFYNNAEAQHHHAVTHLGMTHLLMEGICVCTHRRLSPSHPVFKLLAPHFRYLLAVNSRALEKLITPGGWVDTCCTQGYSGIVELMKRGFAAFNFTKHGNPEKEISERGLLDKSILPQYPYRDDSLLIFAAIKKYVFTILDYFYEGGKKLSKDTEIQSWKAELSLSRVDGGVGLEGLPGNDAEGFKTLEELVETTSIIIFICSVGHAATNFNQYHQYSFIPNYPGILTSPPPITKHFYRESALLSDLFPDMRTTLDTMVVTKLLSGNDTNPLAKFEVQFFFHPVAMSALEVFQKDLQKISLEIDQSNLDRKWPYTVLKPENVPNSIAI